MADRFCETAQKFSWKLVFFFIGPYHSGSISEGKKFLYVCTGTLIYKDYQ